MIKIVAHRGNWIKEEEKNSKNAFIRALKKGYGIETDVRDVLGKIVISHNMPKGGEILFEELLEIINGSFLPLAINIKADGLAGELKLILEKYNYTNYFTFDMSIPDMICQHKAGLNVFTGLNDIITKPVLYEKAQGVWLDCFQSDWFSEKEITDLLNDGKKVCIVSPDLHNREYRTVWERYKDIPDIMLCTDHPDEAAEFFNE